MTPVRDPRTMPDRVTFHAAGKLARHCNLTLVRGRQYEIRRPSAAGVLLETDSLREVFAFCRGWMRCAELARERAPKGGEV